MSLDGKHAGSSARLGHNLGNRGAAGDIPVFELGKPRATRAILEELTGSALFQVPQPDAPYPVKRG